MSGYLVKSTLYTSIVQYPLLILTKLWRVDKKATERWRFYPELHSRPTMRGLFVLLSLAAGAQAKNKELFGEAAKSGYFLQVVRLCQSTLDLTTQSPTAMIKSRLRLILTLKSVPMQVVSSIIAMIIIIVITFTLPMTLLMKSTTMPTTGHCSPL